MATANHPLKPLLRPLEYLTTREAINPIYRTLEIGPEMVRGCLNWGIAEVVANLGIDPPVYVDKQSFLSMVQSLPNKDLTLEHTDNALRWRCGNARGKLSCTTPLEIPAITWPNSVVASPLGLAKALELGSISCLTSTLSASGMDRIVIEQEGDTVVVSSTDNISLSAGFTNMPPTLPRISTLPPAGVELLSKIMQKDGVLAFDNQAWYYGDDVNACRVSTMPPLTKDISKVRQSFSTGDMTIPIPYEVMNRFSKGAGALAQSKQLARIGIAYTDGKLVLGFKDGNAAMMNEYFEVEPNNWPDVPEVLLDINKLARALKHVETITLDHVQSKNVLLFRGPGFDYMLCGKRS